MANITHPNSMIQSMQHRQSISSLPFKTTVVNQPIRNNTTTERKRKNKKRLPLREVFSDDSGSEDEAEWEIKINHISAHKETTNFIKPFPYQIKQEMISKSAPSEVSTTEGNSSHGSSPDSLQDRSDTMRDMVDILTGMNASNSSSGSTAIPQNPATVQLSQMNLQPTMQDLINLQQLFSGAILNQENQNQENLKKRRKTSRKSSAEHIIPEVNNVNTTIPSQKRRKTSRKSSVEHIIPEVVNNVNTTTPSLTLPGIKRREQPQRENAQASLSGLSGVQDTKILILKHLVQQSILPGVPEKRQKNYIYSVVNPYQNENVQ